MEVEYIPIRPHLHDVIFDHLLRASLNPCVRALACEGGYNQTTHVMLYGKAEEEMEMDGEAHRRLELLSSITPSLEVKVDDWWSGVVS